MQMDFKPWQVDPNARVELDLREALPARARGPVRMERVGRLSLIRLGAGLLFLVAAVLVMPIYWLGLGLFVAVSVALRLLADLVGYGAEVTVGRPAARMR